MQFSNPNSNLQLITCLIISIVLFRSISADPRTSEAGLFCGQTRPPPNTSYIPLFVKEMELLSQQVTTNGWGYHEETIPKKISIYGLAQCLEDLSHTDCLLCYAASRTKLPRCLPSVSARIYLDGCFLRYDDYNFYNETVDPVMDTFNCSSSIGRARDTETASFGKAVRELIDNVSVAAVMNKGYYAVMKSSGVYGLAQCWKTLSKEGCRQCLAKASRNVKGCAPSMEGRGLNAGCYLRYSTQKFYVDKSDLDTDSGAARAGRTVALVCAVIALCLLSLFAVSVTYTRFKRSKQERNNLGSVLSLYNKSNLNFKYETLEKATKYFDESRRIGQGGAGSVYKGTLSNGKIVAVKRLFFSTRQWVDEFFNEINLISDIHHKNLVKLLGCSIEGPESLLVYEFVPNGSLDHYLFVEKTGNKILSWKERLNIIFGTAEAIAFLHGGTKIRIIHRDIKSSNVLLDEKFSPKVADFGLARCFSEDKTHLSTGIAGTLGYMAPEYLVKGQLTEKADVYSFGVLLLEIVCGKKNTASIEENSSLPQNVWKHYKMEKMTETVDSCLKGDYPEKEASKVLKIGLLCTQASAALRPSMEEVIQMLSENCYEIPEPDQPPFLNASMVRENSPTGSSSHTYSNNSNNSAPNTSTKTETFSYSSAESIEAPAERRTKHTKKLGYE